MYCNFRTGKVDTYFHATILLVSSYRFIHSYELSNKQMITITVGQF